MLDWSMAHRWVIVLAMIGSLFLGAFCFVKVNKNFLPQDDESQFQVQARAAEGASLQTTSTIAESIAARIRRLPEVDFTVVTIGDDPQITQNLATVYVKLKPVEKRKRDQFAIMADVRQNILPQYGRLHLRTNVSPVNAFGGGVNAEIMYWIGGARLKKTGHVSAPLPAHLKENEAKRAVQSPTKILSPQPETRVGLVPHQVSGPRD